MLLEISQFTNHLSQLVIEALLYLVYDFSLVTIQQVSDFREVTSQFESLILLMGLQAVDLILKRADSFLERGTQFRQIRLLLQALHFALLYLMRFVPPVLLCARVAYEFLALKTIEVLTAPIVELALCKLPKSQCHLAFLYFYSLMG